MGNTGKRPQMRVQPEHELGPVNAWLRTQWYRAGDPIRQLQAERLRILAHAGGERAKRWKGRTGWGWVLIAAAILGAVLLVFRIVIEFWAISIGTFRLPPAASYHSGYDLVTGLLTPFALAGVGYLFFLLWRLSTFRKPYQRTARKQPEDLVETSGTILGEIVGRDDLCRAIMEDLRDSSNRRPHVIVGDVGAGKTATLVRLTTLLAQKGAFPVPLRLRDCGEKLNFRQAAYDRFKERSELFRVSHAEADRIWQQLSKDNKIVVLADGLEEALQELDSHDIERDSMIRLAIHDARMEKLPIVIASRPHAPLRGMEASITELEPLGERDALDYLRRNGRGQEDARLRGIVETAEVSDSPLYLQITDELNRAELLHHIPPRHDRDRLETRDADRVGLRLHLLETWVRAVIDGYLHGDIPLDRKARQATVEQLSALACAGLMNDSLVVNFSDFVPQDIPEELDEEEKRKREQKNEKIGRLFDGIRAKLSSELNALNWRFDLQLAAAHGQQLGLVEPHGDGVRYPHSIMQAYLGSRYMDVALQEDGYKRKALNECGREFLLALVMCARRCGGMADPAHDQVNEIVGSLVQEAQKRAYGTRDTAPPAPATGPRPATEAKGRVSALDAKTLNLYTHAVQLIPETDQPRLAEMAATVRALVAEAQVIPEEDWIHFEKMAGETVAEIRNVISGMWVRKQKREAVNGQGEQVAEYFSRPRAVSEEDRCRVEEAAAAARALSSGTSWRRGTGRFGEAAAVIGELLSITRNDLRKPREDPRTLEEARLQFVYRLGEAVRRTERELRKDHSRKQRKDDWFGDLCQAYRELFALGVCEPSYAVRLAAAQEIGAGGDLAYKALQGMLKPPSKMPREEQQRARRRTGEERLRDLIMRAWLVPMLAGSVTPVDGRGGPDLSQQGHSQPELAEETAERERSWQVRQDLGDWLTYAASLMPAASLVPAASLMPEGTVAAARKPEEPFPVNLTMALAQGFKYVANWRRLSPYSRAGSRRYLADQAEKMLHQVDFWYARLTLLQALTLWSLPDGPGNALDGAEVRSPEALVRQWLVMREDEVERAGKARQVEHPFVAQAARLCVFALETRQPERFLWIDDRGVVSKTGSGPSVAPVPPRRELWIPQSAGWSALDPRAQQLVADLVILRNLAEGGQPPRERERRLQEIARPYLPWCLTRDRTYLDPVRTVDAAGTQRQDIRSACAPDCLFKLCPYPQRVPEPPPAELSEAFCRRQRIILGATGRIKALRLRLTAPWQGETKTQLRRSWDAMAERSR